VDRRCTYARVDISARRVEAGGCRGPRRVEAGNGRGPRHAHHVHLPPAANRLARNISRQTASAAVVEEEELRRLLEILQDEPSGNQLPALIPRIVVTGPADGEEWNYERRRRAAARLALAGGMTRRPSEPEISPRKRFLLLLAITLTIGQYS
jgi:hypothetical protein